MRVYERAKELGITSKELLSRLEAQGISLASHMSVLTEEALKVLGAPAKEKAPVKKKVTKKPASSTKKETPQEADKQKKVAPKKTEATIKKAPSRKDDVSPQSVSKSKEEPSEQRVSVENLQEQSPIVSRKAARLRSSDDAPVREITTKRYRVEEDEQLRYQLEGQSRSAGVAAHDKISQLLQGKKFGPDRRRPTGRRKKRRRKIRHDRNLDKIVAITEVAVTQDMPLYQAAALLGKTSGDLILTLIKKGMVCNRNNILSVATVEELAQDFGIALLKPQKTDDDLDAQLAKQKAQEKSEAKTRWPVAVVMGHVDHGKTTLLDFVRNMNVAAGEKGGITQHLGAYEVDSKHGKIVFLDTPGHEAFTAIRERGARITDIAVLIVAVDDGVKPQTVEAIKQAQQSGVPIIVAINKVDKEYSPSAMEKIKQQLSQYELMAEDWGGQTVMVPISAKTGTGVDELLEMIVLQSEMMDLKADPNLPAKAYVLESRMEKGYGAVATIICTEGTVKQGDYFVCGDGVGRVRLLINSQGQKIKQAGPSIPVQIVGFDGVASIGEWFTVVPQAVYNKARSSKSTASKIALEGTSNQTSESSILGTKQNEINLLIKTDTRGSKDALIQSIEKLSEKHPDIKCPINIVASSIGSITESDVELAANTNSMIIGLHAKPEKASMLLAKKKEVKIDTDGIIYKLIDRLEELLISKKEAVIVLVKTGQATVRKVFDIKGLGVIAGCYMNEGTLTRNSKVMCMRNGQEIGQAAVTSLQRERKTVKEVHAGYECGFITDTFHEWKVDDVVICFKEMDERDAPAS